MTYRHALLLYQTVTPLHVGCGQDVGVVDLPIIRERTTGYPVVPGSGIRGTWRGGFEERDEALAKEERLTDLLFGPEARAGEESGHAGCLAVHDAKVLLFPVRSDCAVFLWVTCPAVLHRFSREIELFAPGAASYRIEPCGDLGAEELVGPEALGTEVHLEEFLFHRRTDNGAASDQEKLATWGDELSKAASLGDLASRTVLVADSTFSYFVRFATVVEQHNRLSSAKTVVPGGLFSLEALPPETVLYGFAGATDSRRPEPDAGSRLSAQQALDRLRNSVRGEEEPRLATVHLGGNESTGLGVTRLTWLGGEA